MSAKPYDFITHGLNNSVFEHVDKMYDSLPSGKDLSGRIDFVRQLDRLISEHDVVVVATRNTRGKNIGGSSSCEG